MPLHLPYVAIHTNINSIPFIFSSFLFFLLLYKGVFAIPNSLAKTVKCCMFHAYLHHVRMEELAEHSEWIIMSANALQVRN